MDDKMILKYLYLQQADVKYNIEKNHKEAFELNERLKEINIAIKELETGLDVK